MMTPSQNAATTAAVEKIRRATEDALAGKFGKISAKQRAKLEADLPAIDRHLAILKANAS